jgi:hypothetical protein
LVQHERLCDGASVHDWHEPAQSGPWSGLPQSRSRRDAPRAPVSAQGVGSTHGDLQRDDTPPFGAPKGVFGSAAFGTITSAGDPRVVQLALKFVF